eukprot:Nk52_evm1s259 gene=Nk52_evmTU1s259
MPHSCQVVGCYTGHQTKVDSDDPDSPKFADLKYFEGYEVSAHTFPINDDITLQKWIIAIGREEWQNRTIDDTFREELKKKRVCSKHFNTQTDFMPNSKRRNAVKLRLKDKAVPSRFLRVEAPKEWYSSSVEKFLLYDLHVHHKDDPDPVGSMLSQLRAHRRNSVDAVRYEGTREDLQIQHYNVCHLNGRELADLVQSLEDDEDQEFHQMLNEKASYLKYNFRSKLDFVLEQTELMVKSSALKEWTSKISFNVAYVLYSSSPGAYLQLLSTGCLDMPSVRTICRFNQDHHGMSTDEFGHDNESNVKYFRNRVNADREE